MPRRSLSLRALTRLAPMCAILGLAGAAPALAHDFLLKPGTASAGNLPVQVLLTEIPFTGDVVLPLDAVTLTVASAGQSTVVPLAANAQAKALEGTVSLGSAPAAVTATLSRVRPARQAEGRPPEPATKSESTSTTFVNYPAGATSFQGGASRLEIVPQANPADLKVGEELPLKITFDGKPLGVRLFATYDGFSTREGTFATTTPSEKDGIAYVKITAPGLWLVKASHSLAEDTPTHARYSASTSLVFAVK